MIVYAAIDLSRGRVVQLVGGVPQQERVNLPDPVAVSQRWIDSGFAALHVIDLDAALGMGSNRSQVEAIISAASVPVQVGGGIRDEVAVEELISLGAASVIVGTRAIEQHDWLSAIAHQYPDRIVVAADVRDREVVVEGWTAATGITVTEILDRLEPLPLAGVLVTDVGREGKLEGTDHALFRSVAAATEHRILAAGGITTADDLEELSNSGVAGAVVGMALYTGAIDPEKTAKEHDE
jgi:phosphoribosylformimino-5-aminoimidazole carboxamide ribotide isomerase